MTLARALHIIQSEQAAIGTAACRQNPDALAVQAASALFSQKPNADTAARLVNAVAGWQQYREANPTADV